MEQLDLLVMGSVMVEITPIEEGVPIERAVHLLPLPSGAATNFALAARRLGVSVGVFSRVGDDEWGQWLCNRLQAAGIDVSRIWPVEKQYSPVSFCWMDRQGRKTFYFYRFEGFCDPLATVSEEDVTPALVQNVRCFDFTEATIRKAGLRAAAFKAARLARQHGGMVVYAVNYRPAAWMGTEEEMLLAQRQACSLANVAVMTAEEARMISGFREPLQAAAEIARLGPEIVAVTGGADGAWVLAADTASHVPAFDVQVRYDIGAGDAFHAGLVVGLLRGLTPLAAVKFASAVAALKISRPPAIENLPTWDEALALAQSR